MSSMKKRHVVAITSAIESRRMLVPLNSVWRDIHQEFSIGIRKENKLRFSSEDLSELRKIVEKTAGFDPLNDSPCFDSRMDAAKTVVDEKWGGGAGSRKMVNVYRKTAPINTIHGICTVPPGCGLWLDIHDLVLTPDLRIVIVENMAAFLSIDVFRLPTEWQDALFVYRGHDKVTAGSNALLERIPEGTCVAVMSDYDAAGLVIAVSTRAANGWLGPALDAHLGISHTALFEKQAMYIDGLASRSHDGLSAVIERLINERIAFTQERMAATQVQIVFHPF